MSNLSRLICPKNYFKERNIFIKTDKTNKKIKITFLADLHISKIVNTLKTTALVNYLKIINPDYICILGDIIDKPKVVKNKDKKDQVINFFKDSSLICPVVFIKGNHDLFDMKCKENKSKFYKDVWKEIENIKNVYYLDDSIYETDDVLIMGYTQKEKYYYDEFENRTSEDLNLMYKDLSKLKKLYNINEEKINIGLIHSPYFRKSKEIFNLLEKYDLLASGHFHGGCMPSVLDDIFLNGNRGIISPRKKWFPTDARGIKKINNTYHLINSGMEHIQGCAPKILQPLNNLCYSYIDNVIFDNSIDSDEISYNYVNIKTLIKK